MGRNAITPRGGKEQFLEEKKEDCRNGPFTKKLWTINKA